jgi:hypothetical protein
MTRLSLTLILTLLVAACAVFKPTGPNSVGREPTKQNSPESRYFLSLTPSSLGRYLSLSQLVIGEFEDRTYRAQYEVEIVDDRLTIVGLSPLGITLFTLIQTGDIVTIDSSLKELSGFDPRYTLFDLYLSYWPPDVLARALKRNGLTLDVDTEKYSRTVRDAEGNTVATVNYPRDRKYGGTTVIVHVNPPYRLRVSSLGGSKHP